MSQKFGRALLLACALLFGADSASAQTPPSYVLRSALLPLLVQAPENSWVRANSNLYSDVWTSPDLEPLDFGATHTPARIIIPWSGFAWDSNRGDLILYGGGHHNYSGNDVYRWHSATLAWERAALPSEIYLDPVSGFRAIDGVDHAPSSAHTYDNNLFLPLADRFLTWGGAAYDNGGPYLRVSETDPTQTRTVGPYLFNPALADGNKVGGSSGSNVQRVTGTPIAGGNMWENRDITLHLAGQDMPGSHVNGCTGYATENGLDVVYVGARYLYGSNLELWRYQLTSISNPYADTISKVGAYWTGAAGTTTCAYDAARKLFVRTGTNSMPFTFWDLSAPGPGNIDQAVQIDATIAGLQTWLAAQTFDIQSCALDFDATRHDFLLWCGGGSVWELHEPAAGNTTSGWTVTQRTPVTSGAPTTADQAITVLGKWKYIPFYDVFMALEDANEGAVWLYKPAGWVQPNVAGNALPSVTITSPAPGTNVAPAAGVTLAASAADSDGTISRVEWYVNGVKIGQSTSAPYTFAYAPVLVGSYSVVALAVDSAGGMKASTPVAFNVAATLTTTVLQRGLSGYAGVADTFLQATAPTTPAGGADPLYLDLSSYTPLVRFAIFQSEGGPVPDDAVFQSATLSLYKQYYTETFQLNALLKPWTEAAATWMQSSTGVAWGAPGANAPGIDYDPTIDAMTVATDFNPSWVDFDVTDRVQAWSGNSAANFGWRMSQASTSYGSKLFLSSEDANASLRPKLTLVYSVAAPNQPPMVSLTSPTAGASIALGSSFTVAANATDSDGSIAKVEFFANGVSIGQLSATPYSLPWTPGATGAYALTAVATDNRGATTTSAAVNVSVTAGVTTTVVLQRGLNSYAGIADTFLDAYLPTTIRGSYDPLYLNPTYYAPLVRFAIFESEGGPVPNDATIASATLSLYKQYYDDTLRVNALLKPWVESQATWNQSQTGIPWTASGAAGSGTDYNASADASVAVGWNPGWVAFDVTNRVAQWATGANYGWRLSQAGTATTKQFLSSEDANASLRPKLTIAYTPNQPPTVSLTSPAPGASIALGSSFTVAANASDSDGSIAKVQFFANGVSIGQLSATPYSLPWTPGATGAYTLTAVATDNRGATTTSAAVNVSVTASTTTTVILQRGLNSYAGVADTFLDRYLPTTIRGSYDPLYLNATYYTPLVRFAIFQSEGGPVPNAATIVSATLALYKQYYNDTFSVNALLKPWAESQATWMQSQTGVAWTASGAAGSGTDYNASVDASVAAGWNPGWVAFDVTNRVAQWAAGANYGWRLSQASASVNRQFLSSEDANASLRPKLTVVYK